MEATRILPAYPELAGEIAKRGITNDEIARWINKSTNYVSSRLKGKGSFNVEHSLIIAKKLERPTEELFKRSI